MDKLLIQFINQYFGVPNVGDTPQNIGECVGLIEKWLDVIGVNNPHLWGNAKDLLADADPSRFEIVYNDPNNYTQFPPSGAILVFDSSWGNGLGHCGLVIRANGYTFTLFEQNDPVGTKPTITNFRNYAGVLGWFYPKNMTA